MGMNLEQLGELATPTITGTTKRATATVCWKFQAGTLVAAQRARSTNFAREHNYTESRTACRVVLLALFTKEDQFHGEFLY